MLVACVRTVQSAAHIGQWLDYHLAVGFTFVHFLLDTKSSDGTERVLAPYVNRGVADVSPVHMRGRSDSTVALAQCLGRVVAYADARTWYMVLDDDEVLVPPLAEHHGVQRELERVERQVGRVDAHSIGRFQFSSLGGPCTSLRSHFLDRFTLRSARTMGLYKLLFRPHALLRLAHDLRLNTSYLECKRTDAKKIGELRHGPISCCPHGSPYCMDTSKHGLRLNHYTMNMSWRLTTHTSERLTAHHLAHAEKREPSEVLDDSMARFLPLVSPASQRHNITLRIALPGQLGNQMWSCAMSLALRKRLELFGHVVHLDIANPVKHPSILDPLVWNSLRGHPCEGGRRAAPDDQRHVRTGALPVGRTSWTWSPLCQPESLVSTDTTITVEQFTDGSKIGQWDSISSVASHLKRMSFAKCGKSDPGRDEIVVHVRNFAPEFRDSVLRRSHFRELPPQVLVSTFLSSKADGQRPVAVVGASADGFVAALRHASPERQVRLVSSKNALEDLCFLSRTQYRLIVQAKSSFGWWGAFLSSANHIDAWTIALPEDAKHRPAIGAAWDSYQALPTGQWGRNWKLTVLNGSSLRVAYTRGARSAAKESLRQLHGSILHTV